MVRRLAALLISTLLVSFGCASTPDPSLDGITIGADLRIDVAIDEIAGPTQFQIEEDGAFVIAQINGGERERSGRVVRSSQGDESVVLFDALDKPTGVVRSGGDLWVIEATQLSRGPAAGGDLDPILTDLPNNGRSQGTLTLTPTGDVLFDTSGSKRGSTVQEGSGRLWKIGDDGEPVEVASGFKHAYAHAFVGDELWTTEMSDGEFDGLIPADEVVRVVEGADHGWPLCVGNNRPVAEYGMTDCAGVPESLATFDPGATPTGIAVSPFTPDHLLVALWSRGEVVSVSLTDGSTEVLLSGLAGPQHLLAHEGSLYISEFGANRILKVSS